MQACGEWRVDHFKLLKELGEGLSGQVYSARNQQTGETVALKLLEQTEDEEYAEKARTLQNEQKFLAQLEHPHIIKFHGFFPKGRLFEPQGARPVSYIVMELAHRGEIFDVLFHYGAFDCNAARYYIRQLVDALNFLHHQGKAHRDVKPENILLDKNLAVKLADFGFATEVAPGKLNWTNLGTPTYMSPELVANQACDARKNDVWAAGMVLFIFCAGRLPFNVAAGVQDPYFKLFVGDRPRFWAEQAKLPPRGGFAPALQQLLEGMLEPDFARRLSLDQVLETAWMNEPCDAKKALRDMDAYYQKTQQIVHMQRAAELQTEGVALEGCRSAAPGSWFEDVDIPPAEEGGERCLTFESAAPRAVLDQLRHFLCDGTTVLKKEKGAVLVVMNSSHGEASARLFVGRLAENKFGLCVTRRGGNAADVHALKHKIQSFFWSSI